MYPVRGIPRRRRSPDYLWGSDEKAQLITSRPGHGTGEARACGRCRLRPRRTWLWSRRRRSRSLLPVLSQLQLEPSDLLVFALLCLGAAFGSILIVSTERNHGFNTALVFIAAAVVLLPPALVALMGLAQYWPELVRRRYPVVHASSSTSRTTRSTRSPPGAPGISSCRRCRGRRRSPTPSASPPRASSSSARTTCCWRVRCASDAPARCARRASFRGRASRPISCSPPLGVTVAGVWEWNPYLVPLTIAPFVLISRSFSLLELLHRSERRFRAIYESTAVGIGLTDTAGRLVDHNRALRRDAGRSG